MGGILVIGPVFVDIKGYPLSTYIPAGRNMGTVEYVHGGVSRNIVEDIANMELRPTFLSLVDDTGIGQDVKAQLENHKVNTKYMRTVKDGMGTWLAVFDNTGDVVAAISKRPELDEIYNALLEQGDEMFAECKSITLEMDLDKELVKKVIELAEKHGKDIYGVVSNMSIAIERRDLFKYMRCFVCNQQEMGILFSQDYSAVKPKALAKMLLEKIQGAGIRSMVVTMGSQGAVYADSESGECGVVDAVPVDVKDTTGAGDSFFAGVAAGLSYGKTLQESCRIGTSLAASVIQTYQNVCPRFLPSEFGIELETEE